ncbi:MAG: hypothetical protein LBJ02_08980 [Bifidobacteriaceae bacterium]|jgi:hypothetical protein|nr:hypothetical protein [Bifidobacteriaceae bacterium]
MDLYSTIFSRHSIHGFDPAPLDAKVVEEILDVARQAGCLDGQTVRVEVVGPEQVSGSSAPHHLAAFTAQDDAGFANAGYVLQLADLTIQARGLGSHWLGMPRLKRKQPGFTILLAFGDTSEPPRSEDALNRLELDAISSEDNPVARAVRAAPSGMNDQPWRIEFEDGLVRLIHTKRGPMSMILAKRMDKVSLGIASRHAVIALQHQGAQVTKVAPATASGGASAPFSIEISYQ